MIYDRLILGRVFLSQEGSLWCTISDDEFKNLLFIIETIYGKSNFIANIVWQKRTSPDARLTLGAAHDYVIVFANEIYSFKKHKRLLPLTEGRVNDYKNPDNDPRGVWASVDLTGQVGHATESQFYEIVTPGSKKYTPPKGRCWAVSEKTFHSLVEEGRIWFGQNGLGRPRLKRYLSEAEGISAWTWWGNQEVGHNQEAKKECNDLLNIGDNFETSKPIKLLQRILQLGTISTSDIVIDYFAGSGTTGHAVINLNREDAGNRKYILVEMGEHFDTVLKPRIQKVIYSKDWKDGKPVYREGISHCFKYIRLESYEDALNNIEITKLDKPQQLTLDQYQDFRESYMLSYILEMETNGSASLLNVEAFDKPFDYKLKIWQNDEFQEIAVDLVETFNYLLGLNVQRVQTLDNVRIVKGINRQNQKVLIIWRNLNELDNDTLEEWFIKHFLEHEFDLIYVNCDNNLANIRPANATWQVLLTEAEFKRLMFDIQDI